MRCVHTAAEQAQQLNTATEQQSSVEQQATEEKQRSNSLCGVGLAHPGSTVRHGSLQLGQRSGQVLPTRGADLGL